MRRTKKLALVTSAGALCRSGVDWNGRAFSEAEWREMERPYGRLDGDTRAQVQAATNAYLRDASIEHHATPLQEAQITASKLLSAVKNFYVLLPEQLEADSDAAIYVKSLVMQNFNTAFLPKEVEKPEFIYGILGSLLAAVRSASEAIDAESVIRIDGGAWATWINRLSNVLGAAGLAIGVSKGSKKWATESHSKLVILVHNIQKNLPPECRRHTTSLDALAKAISVAREV